MIYLLTFAVICIAMLAMASGVLLTGRTIKGSCGGLNGEAQCSICGVKNESAEGTTPTTWTGEGKKPAALHRAVRIK